MSANAPIETVDEWPRPSWAKYDWETILDGKRHVLRKGVHFECAPDRMRQVAHTSAARRGIAVRCAVSGDCLYVEAYGTRRVSKW